MATLYYIKINDHKHKEPIYKIGITKHNVRKRFGADPRIEPIFIIDNIDIKEARMVEQFVLNEMSDKLVHKVHGKAFARGIMQGGYSELFVEDIFKVKKKGKRSNSAELIKAIAEYSEAKHTFAEAYTAMKAVESHKESAESEASDVNIIPAFLMINTIMTIIAALNNFPTWMTWVGGFVWFFFGFCVWSEAMNDRYKITKAALEQAQEKITQTSETIMSIFNGTYQEA